MFFTENTGSNLYRCSYIHITNMSPGVPTGTPDVPFHGGFYFVKGNIRIH